LRIRSVCRTVSVVVNPRPASIAGLEENTSHGHVSILRRLCRHDRNVARQTRPQDVMFQFHAL
jgi:hypothetical protein